ncbi:hypothetical protein OROGR_010216 [Orobanche gracilis]
MDAGRTFTDMSNENPLPCGYKFHPTSFEILQYYLLPKMKGEQLPSDNIKYLDVYQYDPHQLTFNKSKYAIKDEAYYFAPVRELSQGEDNRTITTPNGYWEILHENVPIGDIGYKNKLEFYNGKNPDGIQTEWKMVEYRTNSRTDGNSKSLMVCKMRRKVNVDEIYEEDVVAISGDEDEDKDQGGTNDEKQRTLQY